jgi:hypothetical protein
MYMLVMRNYYIMHFLIIGMLKIEITNRSYQCSEIYNLQKINKDVAYKNIFSIDGVVVHLLLAYCYCSSLLVLMTTIAYENSQFVL